MNGRIVNAMSGSSAAFLKLIAKYQRQKCIHYGICPSNLCNASNRFLCSLVAFIESSICCFFVATWALRSCSSFFAQASCPLF